MASNIPAVSTVGSPPQSVESITKTAQDYEYNESVPLRYWLRTAATLLREVSMTRFLGVGMQN
jgi:STAM-binding protein